MRLTKFFTVSLIPMALLMKVATGYECQSQNCCCDPCGNWYGVVGAGYAFSEKTTIEADPAIWDPAIQGYDARLGNSPFFYIGFGHTFCNWFDLDVTYSYYETFHYQKYQTAPTPSNPPPGFTGNARTRFFDLDHQNVLFDLTIDPICCFSYDLLGLNIRPIIGGGIGVGISHVYNFYTVAYVSVSDSPAVGVGSTTTIGEPSVTKTDFAGRAFAGLRFGGCGGCPISFDIGYRYYYGGKFEGSTDTVTNTAGPDGEGQILGGPPLSGKLRTNEVYFALNWTI